MEENHFIALLAFIWKLLQDLIVMLKVVQNLKMENKYNLMISILYYHICLMCKMMGVMTLKLYLVKESFKKIHFSIKYLEVT